MAVFEYIALDNKGRKTRGVVDADSARSARLKLKSQGIFPTSLDETRSAAAEPSGKTTSRWRFSQGGVKVGLGDLAIATRQLSTLVGASIPLVEALRALSDQLDSDKLKRVFSEISNQVNEGSTLADALKKYPRVFPQLYVNMAASGEASGSLELVLERLSDLLEAQADLRRKIMAASAYPMLMLGLCFVVIMLLLSFVVPQITQIFKEKNQVLPLPTQIVISLSNGAKAYWWLICIFILLITYGLKKYRETKSGKLMFDKLMLRAPLFGPMNLKIATSRFARTLGTMLGSGVELLTALGIVKNIVGNVLLEEAVENSIVGVREGRSLAAELKKSDRFPKLLVHLISVGEKTGQLEAMLLRTARSYESEIDALVSGLTKVLEPILILFLAVIVGGILASVMLPMLEMSSLTMK